MRVFSATAIQISGVNTPSMSKVTIDCFTAAKCFKKWRRCPAVLGIYDLTRLLRVTGGELFLVRGSAFDDFDQRANTSKPHKRDHEREIKPVEQRGSCFHKCGNLLPCARCEAHD